LTAINLGQVAQRRTKTLAKLRPLFPLAGLALILLAMGITAAAWAGLVQFRESTRGWSVQAEPALEQAGKTISAWRAHNHLKGAPVFNFSPAAGDLASWFSPEWNGFLDSRFHASRQELADYVAIRKGLMGLEHAGPDGRPIDWRAALRKQETRLIVV